MESGTAIGLLVGGAVLILAASPKAPAVNGVPQVAPGGYLNPFNWLSGALHPQAGAGAMPAYQQPNFPATASPASPYNARQGGAQPANYSPATTQYGSPNYSAPASPMYYNAAYTPAGGNSAPPVASPAALTPNGAYSPSYGFGNNFQSAAYSPSYSPGGSPTYAV